jgi:hypothetical protein
MLPCGEHSSSTSGITESSSSLCLSNRSSRRFYNKEKDQQHIKLVSTIPHFCFGHYNNLLSKICTYPLLSEQTSNSQQSKLMAHKSYPAPVLLCWWHKSHIPSLYSIMLMVSVSHHVPTLYNADGISHIRSLYSIVLMAHESHPISELRYADGISHIPALYFYAESIRVTSCPYDLLCLWYKSHILSLYSIMLTA